MSWDEKDWSSTWITGKPERFGKFRVMVSRGEKEACHKIYLCGWHVPCLSDLELNKLDEIAKLFGVMIEYRFLCGYIYTYDYRNIEPILNSDEIAHRDLVQEIHDIVSCDDQLIMKQKESIAALKK